MSKLALLGGEPVIKEVFPAFNTIGNEERQSVLDVLDTKVLSGFLGAPSEEFNGGRYVRELESSWCEKFNVKHSISVNSATSGLYTAMGAAGISPGDEVILPPYTMSATAMAPLIYGGIPVFADIEKDTFCIDPKSVKNLITNKTKAIVVVNLFGHPASLHELKKIADSNNLVMIEDNSQAPLAKENNKYAGTIGHIGVFSLNRHKHIQSGEGGVCVTDSDDYANRMKLIRNHGENLVESYGVTNVCNMIGFNYRQTELGAAIAKCQLDKAEAIVARVISQAEKLSSALSGMTGIEVPLVKEKSEHVYYVWASKFKKSAVGISRKVFASALCAEGVPVNEGYVKPLYYLPVFKNMLAFGDKKYPFSLSQIKYEKGLCPVAERMHFEEELGFAMCSYDLSDADLSKIIDAWHKVYENKNELLTANIRL
ncbi:MAG: DegT/DnrJ/EryC1/StrS family aminotransferase [Gammaproteobacteria bacterium]